MYVGPLGHIFRSDPDSDADSESNQSLLSKRGDRLLFLQTVLYVSSCKNFPAVDQVYGHVSHLTWERRTWKRDGQIRGFDSDSTIGELVKDPQFNETQTINVLQPLNDHGPRIRHLDCSEPGWAR